MDSMMSKMVALVAVLAACERDPTQPRALEAASDLAGPVAAADAAIQGLQQRLATRLFEEMGRTGPRGAVDVCRDEAQAITAAVEKDRGIAVGRTSHRLRNPRNAPRSWARPYVEAGAGKKAADARAVTVDLGDRVGVLRPIPAGGVCTTCHGPPERIAPELLRTIRAAYPEDRATGFAEGDLRGFFWAEAPKSSK